MGHGHPEPGTTDNKTEGPVKASYTTEDGVDLTLIRWMLSLTPTERLEVLQQSVRSLARLCNEGCLT